MTINADYTFSRGKSNCWCAHCQRYITVPDNQYVTLFHFACWVSDIKRVQKIVDKDIERRDYRLIDQSHAMIGYRPKWGGRDISTGVKNETEHAIRQGKSVYLVHPEEDGNLGTGPFSIKGHRCSSLGELLDQLAVEQENRQARTAGLETWKQSVYE